MIRAARRPLLAFAATCATAALVLVVLAATATPAAADNCSVFTDCFNQANAAAEAAFGLTLLAGLSLALDFLPFVGTAKGGIEAVTGRDLLTGEELAPWERALGIIPFLPGSVLLRGLDDVGDVAGATRRVGGAPPARHLDEFPNRSLVDEYRNPATTPARRARISEQLGEEGGNRYLRDITGRGDLTPIRPTSDADVAGWADMLDSGQAWPHPVQFGGSRATNIVYWDGTTMHIVEAKGGSSAYGTRVSGTVDPGQPMSQTHPDYPNDVAADMANSSLRDGRNEIGEAIQRAYLRDEVRYVGVRTGGRDALHAGDPTTVVEHVFKEPG